MPAVEGERSSRGRRHRRRQRGREGGERGAAKYREEGELRVSSDRDRMKRGERGAVCDCQSAAATWSARASLSLRGIGFHSITGGT
eukprot:664513-Rhodomonas_salina.1